MNCGSIMSGKDTKKLLIVILGIVIISGIIVIPLLDTPFNWGIQEGDEFVYRVVFIRTIPESWQHQPDWPYPPINTINNSLLWVNISNLPITGIVLNGAGFISNVVNQNKITCTLENGSEVNLEANDLISHCILPTDGWGLIDSYFPSNNESFRIWQHSDTYISEIVDEFFLFGYRKLISDDTSISWFGYVNMTNGMPINVTQRYFDLTYTEEITITLCTSL